MIYSMHLQQGPFLAIASGRKTVELRLYDEKRSRIQPGDEIRFVSPAGESLTAVVTALHRFPDFAALFAALDKRLLGYGEEETADSRDMDRYYPPQQQARYGVVGIAIRLKE